MNNPQVKTYPVTGMSCATCARNVEKALKRQPGVASARVNYANNSAIVEFGTGVVWQGFFYQCFPAGQVPPGQHGYTCGIKYGYCISIQPV